MIAIPLADRVYHVPSPFDPLLKFYPYNLVQKCSDCKLATIDIFMRPQERAANGEEDNDPDNLRLVDGNCFRHKITERVRNVLQRQ